MGVCGTPKGFFISFSLSFLSFFMKSIPLCHAKVLFFSGGWREGRGGRDQPGVEGQIHPLLIINLDWQALWALELSHSPQAVWWAWPLTPGPPGCPDPSHPRMDTPTRAWLLLPPCLNHALFAHKHICLSKCTDHLIGFQWMNEQETPSAKIRAP